MAAPLTVVTAIHEAIIVAAISMLRSDQMAAVASAGLELVELLSTSDPIFDLDRLSVQYQPFPLNMIPTGLKTLRREPPHSEQWTRGLSLKCCHRSTVAPQSSQQYS